MDADVNTPHLSGAHLIDSVIFGDQWATEFSRECFAEANRVRRWVEVIAAFGRAQATLGIIPRSSADAIDTLVDRDIDLVAVAEQTRATRHSTLGLIRVLQSMLPEAVRQHVYYGTTVQDITDTAMVLEMRVVGERLRADLRRIETHLISLAEHHRLTPMVGRTHGQPGSPISFGLKAASWLDEVGRSIERLDQMRERILVVQLGGAVGSVGFFGDDALALRAAFADELHLGEPDMSWLTARDRLGEFASVVALTTGAFARLANEIYSLQRFEIGELREATTATTVGSITMPHKRNPESSEQIIVLARLVRANAATLLETMLQEHERDARGWKAEWSVFPELCHYSCAATAMTEALLAGLEVDTTAMLHNVVDRGHANSENLLRQLSVPLGKHRAQELLVEGYRQVRDGAAPDLATALMALVAAEPGADTDAIRLLFDRSSPSEIDLGSSAAMVDRVVARARSRRGEESASW
jgi:adenylosuccinate lyase